MHIEVSSLENTMKIGVASAPVSWGSQDPFPVCWTRLRKLGMWAQSSDLMAFCRGPHAIKSARASRWYESTDSDGDW
jgi:hypothetical protein